jgi:hypothetical protein
MPVVLQTLTPSFTPPAAVAAWPVSDTTNSKTKVIGYPLAPAAGAPAISTFQLNRALTGAALAKLLTLPTNPLTAVVPTTQTGLAAYRQCPNLGLARNLVTNGGFLSGSHGWTLDPKATVVADSASPTGYALLAVGPAGSSYASAPVEAGKAYSAAAQVMGDGTNYGYLGLQWLDAAGSVISQVNSGTQTATAYAEKTIVNQTAPGNARTARLLLTFDVVGVIARYSALRFMQQAGAPAAWTAAHQQYVSRGLEIYEAATNLLTNGDVESALSGTADGFNDGFANLAAWAVLSGSTFTVAANVVTGPGGAGNRMGAGHSDWWDLAAGTRLRFKWTTGAVVYWFLHYVDANNHVRVQTDGANFNLIKTVAGVGTSVYAVADVAANGTWYWFGATVTGTSWTCTLNNDNAGAFGTQRQTSGAQTIADAAIQTGQMAVQLDGTGPQMGGAFANVCRVVIAAPPGFAALPAVGVSAFAVSKVNKFSGTQSLAVYNRDVAAQGYWTQATTHGAGATLTYSVMGKTANIVLGAGVGARIVSGDGSLAKQGWTSADWSAQTATGAVTGANQPVYFGLHGASGSVWFDLLWVAAQYYDTGNADPSGQAHVATGARTASSNVIPLPSTFDITNFALSGVVRFDHAYNRGGNDRIIASLYIDGNNRIEVELDPSGNLLLVKRRAGVVSQASDAAATALAPGDTLSWGAIVSPTGLVLFVSKNGGAVATYTSTASYPQEGLLPIAGVAPTTLYLGRYGGAVGYEIDGTVGATRVLKAGLANSTVSARVLDPYGDPTDNDLAVWNLEGQTVQLPVFDDRLIKLGTAYDYTVDSTSASPNAATAFGQRTRASTAALAQSWWLRSQQDAAKDILAPVLDRHEYDVGRGAQEVRPASGGFPSLIYGGAREGMRGALDILVAYSTAAAADSAEQALLALLGTQDTLWLLSPFGMLAKIRFPSGVHFIREDYRLQLKLSVLEVL